MIPNWLITPDEFNSFTHSHTHTHTHTHARIRHRISLFTIVNESEYHSSSTCYSGESKIVGHFLRVKSSWKFEICTCDIVWCSCYLPKSYNHHLNNHAASALIFLYNIFQLLVEVSKGIGNLLPPIASWVSPNIRIFFFLLTWNLSPVSPILWSHITLCHHIV